METPTLEFRPWSGDRLLPASAQTAVFIAALAALALTMMLWPPAASATSVFAAAAVLLTFATLAYRHSQWRIFALLLIVEALPSANFLPLTDAERPLLRYPLYLLFCAPTLPMVWRSEILSRGGFRLYAVYFAWAFASAAWSLVPMFSFGRAFSSSLLFVAICSVAANIDDNEALLRMVRYVLVACAVLTAIIAFTAITPWFPSAWLPDSELGAYRLQGMFDSPNQVGELNMITIGAALACWESLRWPGLKIAAAALIGVSALMMVAADCRSAAVAMLLSMAALAVWRFGWRGLFGVIAAGALTVLLAAQLSPQALLYLLRSDVTTLSGRTAVMHFSLGRVIDKPLTGYGFGVEGQIFQNRYFPSWDDLWEMGPRIPIHNGYLSRAVGLGVPAALLWMFLFLRPSPRFLRAALIRTGCASRWCCCSSCRF
jgi:O-antigen ligase